MTGLQQSGVDDRISGRFSGGIAYADDLSLLSTSREGMHRLLEICEIFATDYCLNSSIQKVNQLDLGRGDPFTLKRQLSPSMESVRLKYMMSFI